MTDEELKAAVKAFMDKHSGDHGKAVELLLSENRDYRQKNAKLKAALDESKGKAAPDGAVILSGDDAKTWAAYQQLGKPDEIAKALDDSKAAASQLHELAQESVNREVADAYGYKPSVLKRLANGLTFKVKTEEKDGKPVKSADVEVDGKPVELGAYAKANWSDFLPALQATGSSGGGNGAGTGYVNQSSGGKAPKADPFAAYAAKTYGGAPKKDKE